MLLTKCYNHVTNSNTGMIIFLFSISFAIRIGFLMPVALFDVPLIGDEIGYFSRAVGFENILRDISHARLPPASALARAYAGGFSPPLHPFLLALGLFLFGKHVAVARLVPVVLSAMTTPLVYLWTLRLSTKKAAILAAFIHILYPSFIAYSHYLWSETTCIFMLLLALYFTALLSDAQINRKGILYATLSGFFLGFCGLTRAAALPFLIVVPLWLILSLKETRRRILLPSTVICSWLIVLLPWLSTLRLVHGRFMPLSTAGGFNLYLGNNPWVPNGFGSSWGHPRSKALIRDSLEEYLGISLAVEKDALARGLDMQEIKRDPEKFVGAMREKYPEINLVVERDVAVRELAMQEIKGDLKGFLVRCVYRLRMLWASDFFALRHIFHTVYPPLPYAVVVSIWSIVLASYITLIALAAWGFLGAGPGFFNKSLIGALVIAGMVPPVITVAMTRLHLPLLALLLPAAGHGAANLKQRASFNHGIAMTLIILLLCLFIFTSLPIVVSAYLGPSSFYSGLINRVDGILGSNTPFTDQIILRAEDIRLSDHVKITLRAEGYLFRTSQTQEYDWKTSPQNKELALDIYSYNATVPLEMLLFSERLGQSVVIRPIGRPCWRQWQPSGLNGIEYMWSGGGISLSDE